MNKIQKVTNQMRLRKSLVSILLTAVSIIAIGIPIHPSHAGVLSNSISKALAEKAAQRVAVKEAAERGAARTSIERTATARSTSSQTAEKAAAKELTTKQAESQRANRLYRENKIDWAEKNTKNLQYDASKHEHGNLPIRTLNADKQVQKYYPTVREARAAMKKGIEPNRHMTATTHGPGRESFKKAQQRYGLTDEPKARVTIQMHKEQQYISTKAIGGARGVSENLPVKRIPPEDVGHLYLGPSKRTH